MPSRSLRENVEAALDDQPPECGVVVVDPHGRRLAEREPLPGSATVIVALGVEDATWRP